MKCAGKSVLWNNFFNQIILVKMGRLFLPYSLVYTTSEEFFPCSLIFFIVTVQNFGHWLLAVMQLAGWKGRL